MLPSGVTRIVVKGLDWVAACILPADRRPTHQQTGTRGEEDAYFYLRRLGYTMVARNFRTPRCRGEIDLIGWDQDVLCFVEVKTRTSQDVKSAEAAVDRQWRFDIVSVYYDGRSARPQIDVFRNASLAA
jgi:putative endonuclease